MIYNFDFIILKNKNQSFEKCVNVQNSGKNYKAGNFCRKMINEYFRNL